MNGIQMFAMIAVAAAGTCVLRFLPFLIFQNGQKVPPFVEWLGKMLPRAVMAMLVVFCLKGLRFGRDFSLWLPAIAGVISTVAMHLWKRNMILSISTGTAVYMILIRVL